MYGMEPSKDADSLASFLSIVPCPRDGTDLVQGDSVEVAYGRARARSLSKLEGRKNLLVIRSCHSSLLLLWHLIEVSRSKSSLYPIPTENPFLG